MSHVSLKYQDLKIQNNACITVEEQAINEKESSNIKIDVHVPIRNEEHFLRAPRAIFSYIYFYHFRNY